MAINLNCIIKSTLPAFSKAAAPVSFGSNASFVNNQDVFVKSKPADLALKYGPAAKIDENIFKSKTFKILFTDEFKPLQSKGENGDIITTVVERKTGKPAEVFIREDKENSAFHFYAPNSENDKEDHLGYVHMYPLKDLGTQKLKKYYIDYMITNVQAKEKYAGIGIRMHQLAVEKSKQEGFGGEVHLYCAYGSQGFHYKSGYRPYEGLTPPISQRELDEDYGRRLKRAAKVGLDVNDMLKIGKDGWVCVKSDKLINETMVRDNILNNPDMRINVGSFGMKLSGKHLDEWLQKIDSQPLLS